MATATKTTSTPAPTKLTAGGTYTQGQSVVDSAGRTGTVQYDAKTGQKLSTGASTTIGGAGGFNRDTGLPNDPNDHIIGEPAPLDPAYQQGGSKYNQTIPQATGSETVPGQVAPPVQTPPAQTIATAGILPNGPIAPGSKFTQGFNNAIATGQPAPQSAGEARSAVASNIPQQPADTSTIDTQLANDKGYQQLVQQQKDYEASESQQISLVDEYKKLTKSAGIDQINTDLVNMKNVIDGTEDDIRNEVQAANGFATDSQVMALASSRNKQLIKNYNTLLDTKTAQMDYINTMVGLQKDDRSLAQQSLQNRMQFTQQELNYRDKFVNNAQEAYKNTINAIGYDGLYASLKNDSKAMGLAEQVLGLQPGQMALAGQAAEKARTQKAQMDALDIQAKRADISNTYSEISARNNPAPKELTAAQAQAMGYGTRTLQAAAVINSLGATVSKKPSVNFPFGLGGLNALKSSSRQEYDQAQRNFVNAVLRRESGAAIAPSEFENAQKQYFPQYGDTPQVLVQKTQNRNTVIQNLLREGGQGNVDPTKLSVSPDGQLIEITN